MCGVLTFQIGSHVKHHSEVDILLKEAKKWYFHLWEQAVGWQGGQSLSVSLLCSLLRLTVAVALSYLITGLPSNSGPHSGSTPGTSPPRVPRSLCSLGLWTSDLPAPALLTRHPCCLLCIPSGTICPSPTDSSIPPPYQTWGECRDRKFLLIRTRIATTEGLATRGWCAEHCVCVLSPPAFPERPLVPALSALVQLEQYPPVWSFYLFYLLPLIQFPHSSYRFSF